jgi:hypothetical protein
VAGRAVDALQSLAFDHGPNQEQSGLAMTSIHRAAQLLQMKPAQRWSISRGLVDDRRWPLRLRSGRLAAAGLDVFEPTPIAKAKALVQKAANGLAERMGFDKLDIGHAVSVQEC